MNACKNKFGIVEKWKFRIFPEVYSETQSKRCAHIVEIRVKLLAKRLRPFRLMLLEILNATKMFCEYNTTVK